MEIEKEGYKYIFDASKIENKATNNKKDIGFYLVKADKENKILNFKIKYQQQNSYDKLKEIFNIKSTTKLQDFLINDFNNTEEYLNIKFNDELKIRDIGNKSVKRGMLDIREKEDTLTDVVTVDFAAQGLDDVCKYLINRKDFNIKREDVEEVFATYARQDKIDFFIHKNAENFLKEQFKQYLFNYIYDNEIVLEEEGVKRAQQLNKLKKIAFEIIEYIAKFENELKEIWEKPKFVRKSNYVLTLDRLKDNIDLIEEIINHPGFNEQIKEWNKLYNSDEDSSGTEIKKQWNEFDFINNFNKEKIIEKNNLNNDYKKLVIDTKYFKNIRKKIIDYFDNLGEVLDGYLIKSDNFQVLNTLKTKYKNKLDITYIDPPFNTGSDFDYIDGYQDSTWLTLLENRLFLLNKLLKNNGTFYLHLDDNANDLGKIISKDIFKKHINDIIWNYRTGGASKKSNLPKKHDFILSFTNAKDYEINPLTERQYLEKSFMNSKKDENGNYYVDTLLRNTFEGVLKIANKDNKIIEYNTRPVLNLSNEFLSFRTQKPEGLLFLLIDIVKENNLIMDAFAGSGTTLATAHKMNKKWLGVEMGEHFYDVLLPRLKKVLAGDKSGISSEVDWKGGGFFKYYELESYEDVLKRAKYNENKDEINKYSFMSDEKMLDALELDYEEENIKVRFENLYPDVDIAETLSNLLGKNIKKLNDKRVVFEDNTEIIFDEMTFEKYPFIKPLIWWGEIDNE
jgi:adenine specific DNA methylase Mod